MILELVQPTTVAETVPILGSSFPWPSLLNPDGDRWESAGALRGRGQVVLEVRTRLKDGRVKKTWDGDGIQSY